MVLYIISVFYIFPLVAQFKGAAVLLESFTGISFKAGLAIISVVIVYPFFKVWDKKQLEKEMRDKENNTVTTESNKNSNVETVSLNENGRALVEHISVREYVKKSMDSVFNTLSKFKKLEKMNV